MSITTKYVLNFFTSTALVVFVAILVFGWDEFTTTLGGVESFTGLIALLIMGAIVASGILFLQGQDYTNRMRARLAHLAIATLVVGVLGGIGYGSVDLPNGTGMRVLGALIACLIAAAVATAIGYIEDE